MLIHGHSLEQLLVPVEDDRDLQGRFAGFI